MFTSIPHSEIPRWCIYCKFDPRSQVRPRVHKSSRLESTWRQVSFLAAWTNVFTDGVVFWGSRIVCGLTSGPLTPACQISLRPHVDRGSPDPRGWGTGNRLALPLPLPQRLEWLQVTCLPLHVDSWGFPLILWKADHAIYTASLDVLWRRPFSLPASSCLRERETHRGLNTVEVLLPVNFMSPCQSYLSPTSRSAW